MSQVLLKLELPEGLERFRLPRGVGERLHSLLNRQDRGEELALDEGREAEGLVELASVTPETAGTRLLGAVVSCQD